MEERKSLRSRATNLQELDSIVSKLVSEDSWQRGLAFQPRSTDVIITSYAKCGTTWLQQIVHGLRTRGSMDFDEIATVTPWIEIAHDMGWDLDAPQVAESRIYKSHLAYHDIPKGRRYICSFRNASDAIVSFYRFYEGWLIEPGTIDLEALFHWRWPRDKISTKGYWYHLTSWWEQRHNDNVLLLCYEDMQADLPATVRKIADFIGIALDDELLEIVVRQSSREFMLAHKDQFDEKHLRQQMEKRAGLPPGGHSHKVTAGASKAARYQLSTALQQQLDEIWQEQVQAKFGFRDYEALRRTIREVYVKLMFDCVAKYSLYKT